MLNIRALKKQKQNITIGKTDKEPKQSHMKKGHLKVMHKEFVLRQCDHVSNYYFFIVICDNTCMYRAMSSGQHTITE